MPEMVFSLLYKTSSIPLFSYFDTYLLSMKDKKNCRKSWAIKAAASPRG